MRQTGPSGAVFYGMWAEEAAYLKAALAWIPRGELDVKKARETRPLVQNSSDFCRVSERSLNRPFNSTVWGLIQLVYQDYSKP